ncbi:MAG: DUF4286 family protein [Muribaculaceae bacterium]|nr:DUF4286 family protein [Muribaculaceae bacterium]
MFTYNITFIVAPDKEQELIDYLKTDILPKVTDPNVSNNNISIKKLIEAGGEKPTPDHGLSIAMAMDFLSEDNAVLWHDNVLLPALQDFNCRFGKEAIFFITLLQKIL